MLEHEEIIAGVRDLQKRHQEEAQCASCHQKIDPIGYGLENFTAAGLWRNDEQVEILADGVSTSQSKYASPEFRSFPIDPSGALPRGETFESYEELRDGILENYSDDFARGLTEHLIAYALGRPYQISDHNFATEVLAGAAENGNSFPAFIHALIQSEPFHLK